VDAIVRVVCVSDRVRASEQHLEGDVGNEFPHFLEALPGTLVEEAEGDVEGGASPVLGGEEAVEVVRHVGGALEEVVGAHPGGQQRLVGVSEGRVHQEETFVLSYGFRETSRTLGQKHVAESTRRLEGWNKSRD